MNAGRKIQSRNPASLLRLFITSACISIAVIALLSVAAFYRVFSGFVITAAEEDSIQLCRVMLDQQRPFLFHPPFPGQKPVLAVHSDDLYHLDRNLRRFLQPFSILKIKIYDASARIIYSTDSALTGKLDTQNRRLANALKGNVDTRLETSKKAHDLVDEQLFDVDVVETYVPIRNEVGTVLGVFEVYVNVTRYRTQIGTGVAVMAVVLIAVLSGAFGVSYRFIRRGIDELREAQAELGKMAVTDPLTEINNRGQLMVRGEEEFARVFRNRKRGLQQSCLGCIMIDIDHFKAINDSRGHLVGDQVLKGVGQRLAHSVRPYDVIGRYGGEEFAVLLPDTTFDQSLQVAERIRGIIHAEPFVVDGQPVTLSVSLGVASTNENDQGLNDVLKRADEGLLKAKMGGRNRVAWVYHPFDSELHG